MLKSSFLAGGLALLLISTSSQATALDETSARQLEPALNGEVSATGLFPTQAMEDAFNDYLAWTRERGLSRLAAFEGELTDGFYGAAVPGPHPGCLTSREESADPFITRSRHARNVRTGPLSAREAHERRCSPDSSRSRRFAARVDRP